MRRILLTNTTLILFGSGLSACASGAGDYAPSRGISDDKILLRAQQENRIVLTFDKDFGELAVLGGKPHAGIIRLVDILPRQQGAVCLQVISLHTEELQKGAIVTATTFRIRIRASSGPDGNP